MYFKQPLFFSAVLFLVSPYVMAGAHNQVEQLEIVSLKRIDPPNDSDSECANWKMNKHDVLVSFRKMGRVDSVEWGALCYVYTCSYQGQVKYLGRLYDMEVNAGAFIKLTEIDGDATLYFIEKKARPYFVSSCNCCEDQ